MNPKPKLISKEPDIDLDSIVTTRKGSALSISADSMKFLKRENSDELYITDYQKNQFSDEDDDKSPHIFSPREWISESEENCRVASLDDFKYEIKQEIYAILPDYIVGGAITKMQLISGRIVEVGTITVDPTDRYVPRQLKLPNSTLDDWTTKFRADVNKDTKQLRQTVVRRYLVELDEPFRLTEKQAKRLQRYAFESDNTRLWIDYRYILGSKKKCIKELSTIKRIEATTSHLINYLKEITINIGDYIEYEDMAPSSHNGKTYHFLVLDYICMDKLDIRYVIKCNQHINRILTIRKLNDFDVRFAYKIDKYYLFKPTEKHEYRVHSGPRLHTFNVRTFIVEIFSKLQVYVVKKSLSDINDIKSELQEEYDGSVSLVPWNVVKPNNQGSGITLTSYAKGLAFKQGEEPTNSKSYIFFHSKDYHNLILDCNSPQFMEFVQTADDGTLFRNPVPKDIILGTPFTCNREQYRGKINLNWFYPTEQIRLLHLYITTDGKHPFFNDIHNPPRSLFREACLCIFDIYTSGVTKSNPTVNSEWTRTFIDKYCWWEALHLS